MPHQIFLDNQAVLFLDKVREEEEKYYYTKISDNRDAQCWRNVVSDGSIRPTNAGLFYENERAQYSNKNPSESRAEFIMQKWNIRKQRTGPAFFHFYVTASLMEKKRCHDSPT